MTTYAERIARGLARGLSRSQARGHPRKGEIPAAQLPPVLRPRLPIKRIKDTTYVETPRHTAAQRHAALAYARARGATMVRYIYHRDKEHNTTSYWMDVDSRRAVDFADGRVIASSSDPNDEFGPDEVIGLAFV